MSLCFDMVARIPEYDLLWKWNQDALILFVIEDVDIAALFKSLLQECKEHL